MLSERSIKVHFTPKLFNSKSQRNSPVQFRVKKRASRSDFTLPNITNVTIKKIQIYTPSESKSQFLPLSPFGTRFKSSMNQKDSKDDFNTDEEYEREQFCIENQIKIIRKKHDKTKEEIKRSQQHLIRLQNLLENFKYTELQINASQTLIFQDAEELQNKISMLKDQYEESIHQKNVYQHIHDRIKQEKMFFENKNKIISKKKDLQQYFLNVRSEKQRRQKEKKSQSLVSLRQVQQLF